MLLTMGPMGDEREARRERRLTGRGLVPRWPRRPRVALKRVVRQLIGAFDSPVAALGLLALRGSRRRVGVALIYHAVTEAGGDPSSELVPGHSARLFERQMRHLRRRYRVVAASQLLEAARRRKRGERFPVAVTFDDDLPCHARIALPILQRVGVPGTFFVCGASMHAPFSFWWERLQRAADESVSEVSDLVASSNSGGRRKTIHSLARVIEEMEPVDRDAIAERMADVIGPDPEEAGMRADDVRALASAGMEIGFHTLKHDPLPSLGDAELERAMVVGKADIERVVGARLTTIAYPHGRADQRVAAAARAAGFEVGFTGRRSPVAAGSDPLLLGRLRPSYWSMGHFALRMLLALLARPQLGPPVETSSSHPTMATRS